MKNRTVENGQYGLFFAICKYSNLQKTAEGNNIAPNTLIETVKKTCLGHNTLVILMHDASTKANTVQALPKIIEYLKSEGYSFKTLQ